MQDVTHSGRCVICSAAAAHRDVDEARSRLAHPEGVAGAVVTEEAVVAEREHRRPPAALGPEQRVADGVDPAVDAMEAADADAMVDLARGQAAAQ
jgi:hypothetical protein